MIRQEEFFGERIILRLVHTLRGKTPTGLVLLAVLEQNLAIRTSNRCVIVGLSATMRTLVVIHTDRGESIRIFSARQATRRERRNYEEGI